MGISEIGRRRPPIQPAGAGGATRELPVWDLFVRFFHWSLVVSMAIALVTGDVLGAPWLALHVTAGLSALALVAMRIVWGFFGPPPARFSSFVLPPAEVLAYARARLLGRDRRHVGHNPLGGAMVAALLACVVGLGLTGALGLGGALKTGPFAGLLPGWLGEVALGVHEALASLVLALIVAHVLAVIHETRHRKDPLVRAMITGRKPVAPGDVLPPATGPARLAAALAWGAGVAAVAGAIVGLAWQLPASGLPTREIPPAVAEECGACHMVYHPSLLPAKAWRDIMATLDDHFGEDASLDEETARDITDWLVAHAAETADTRPARAFASIRPGQRITDTPFWQDRHEMLDDSVFSRKRIASRANCVACHRDAETGMFSPLEIDIPRE